ncbi:hypothetical protein ACLB1S_09510 [Escherichia coli]
MSVALTPVKISGSDDRDGGRRTATQNTNEIALTILLIALTIIFTRQPPRCGRFPAWGGNAVSVTVLVALLVCLIPTTIGGLLSAIGIARDESDARRECGLPPADVQLKRQVTLTFCYWIKPAPSHSVTVRHSGVYPCAGRG